MATSANRLKSGYVYDTKKSQINLFLTCYITNVINLAKTPPGTGLFALLGQQPVLANLVNIVCIACITILKVNYCISFSFFINWLIKTFFKKIGRVNSIVNCFNYISFNNE